MINTWVFFSAEKIAAIAEFSAELKKRLNQWDSHGELVPNAFEITDEQVIVIDAKPGATSGCSIDALHKIVDALLRQHNNSLLTSNKVVYRGTNTLAYTDFREIPELLRQGIISPTTVVFDVPSRINGDLFWEKPLQETWLSKFL